MKRHYLAAALTLALPFSLSAETRLFVSPGGQDSYAGTLQAPFATLQRAQQEACKFVGRTPVTVFLRQGTYYLPKALVFTAADSGKQEAPVIYQAYGEEKPVISGGTELKNLHWKPFKGGIFQTAVPPDLATEEIFVNGERQVLARYPNFDPTVRIFNGFSADAFSKERAARWADPSGGYAHAMHKALWGGYTWEITGKKPDGELILEGGWQNNRGGPPHDKMRFVENIFEELDTPGEWFLDRKSYTLYFYPPKGLDLSAAKIEATRLETLVEFSGSETAPVRFVSLKGITFRHSNRTVMKTKEPLLRTDWAIYRGGALLFHGAEDCAVEDAFVDQVGGTAIFVNDYNRRIAFRGCHIAKAGANGIAFVGDPQAARSPLFNYSQVQSLDKIDRTPGPQTNNYPADCLVEDCLIHLTGRVEKQTAGVEIDLAQNITVRHCSIYETPRAGINIGDGCWGGHVIEFCDVFDTVLETGDHGSFNSWGRDRFWRPNIDEVNALVKEAPELPFLDVVKPITLRNNRWRCDHGWDIDLDDGSSNYIIYNNLCLNGGIKNREGFRRNVYNNITVNNTFHPHVWYRDSGDIFSGNIVFVPYRPVRVTKPWGREMDRNFLHRPGAASGPALELQQQSGRDEQSLAGDALFVDPPSGNYQLREDSPALKLGFQNFPMDQFGVMKPEFKAIAKIPAFPAGRRAEKARRDGSVQKWHGTRIRNILDEGEMSAYGLPGVTGVLVQDIDAQSPLAAAMGLRKNDVILRIGKAKVDSLADLLAFKGSGRIEMIVSRLQKETSLTVNLPMQSASGK